MNEQQTTALRADTGVPPSRFYTVIIIVAVVTGTMMYFVGQQKGKSDTQLEFQEVIIEEQEDQHEIYKKYQCNDIDRCFIELLQR